VQFCAQDNSANIQSKGSNDQLKKELKASHFNIGNPMGSMVNPAPIPPVDSSQRGVKQLSYEETK
jgi:hypothetical protein